MFDSLASFTPQAATPPTTYDQRDILYLGNLLSGGGVKHDREVAKITLQNNLQHRNNFELAKWQAQWNKALDDTKVQRSVKDLEAAGINPILAHGQSLGHSPSGVSAGSSSAVSGSGPDVSKNKLGKLVKMLATAVLKSF